MLLAQAAQYHTTRPNPRPRITDKSPGRITPPPARKILFLRLAKSKQPPSLGGGGYFGRVTLKRLTVALALLVLSSGCSFTPLINNRLSGNRAFIDYWPADANSNRLRLAVKDNIDMQGVVTTAGSQFFQQTHK